MAIFLMEDDDLEFLQKEAEEIYDYFKEAEV